MSDPPAIERIRVLLLINDLARAGAETQLVELALALDRERFDPHIVILKRVNDFADRLATARIPVVALRRRGFWDLRVLPRLGRVIRRLRPDVLHAHLFLGNLHGVVAGRLCGVPAVIASQRTSYDASLNLPLRWLARRIHAATDRVVVNARATLEQERAAGVPAEKLVYIPNGVAVRTPVAAARTPDPPEGPLVLAVGQLTQDKGHLHLLEAWADVRQQHPAARLVILGEGPQRGALEARARMLGLGSSVQLPGFCSDVAGPLARCDVFVQPSINEGMPNAVLEAMAAAKPVVASRVGGVADVLDPASGTLVPPADPRALAGALAGLLSDPARRRSLGEAARQRVLEEFSVEQLAERTAALYGEVLGRPRPT